jgi:CRP-like cAMP-binding protein
MFERQYYCFSRIVVRGVSLLGIIFIMTGFIQFCNRLSPLGKPAEDDILNALQSSVFKKGAQLVKKGNVCRQLFFIEQGLAKICFNNGHKEFIMRFFPENALFTLLDSYLAQMPSQYKVVALEPTSVTYIAYNDMEELCKKHHTIETFFRKLVSLASLNMMSRISEMLEENATNRYNNFVSQNNALLQRISLGDLANYLGITQVSLSRIRARK